MSIDPQVSEWGNPPRATSWYRTLNKIGVTEGTRGTEPSNYPEEKKVKTIPKVVASEIGRAQTESSNTFGVKDRGIDEAF